MKKSFYWILFAICFIHNYVFANMASPYIGGTKQSSAISSKHIQIHSENIHIAIDKNFKTAKFIVEYNILADTNGLQVPLLFIAEDFKENFKVWVDGNLVEIKNVNELLTNNPTAFNQLFNGINNTNEISIYWDKNIGNVYQLRDLKYFETDIAKGNHKIKVEYVASVQIDRSNWVKNYKLKYSLSPAKFWKSFGSLAITLELEGTQKVTTNLGLPIEKNYSTINNWKFTTLPADFIEISFTPTISSYAETLISMGPFGISMVFTILLFAINLYLIFWYRRSNINKKYSPPVIIGSLLIPLISIIIYMYSYSFIDNAIGEEAGKYHGYFILVIIIYPILFLVYLLFTWSIDKLYKRKLLK